MNMNEKAVRLTYRRTTDSRPTIIIGRVVSENETHIGFRTRHGYYFILKTSILVIEPTEQPFEEE